MPLGSGSSWVGLNNILKKLDNAPNKITAEVQRIFEESAQNIENKAKSTVRVDTGRLKSSIKYRVTNKGKKMIGIIVGSDLYYAIYVERRYPYLFPSAEAEKPILIRKLQNMNIWK